MEIQSTNRMAFAYSPAFYIGLAVVCLAVVAHKWQSNQVILQWNVVGAQLLEKKEIIAAAGIKPNTKLAAVSRTEVERRLAKERYLAGVNVFTDGVNSLTIEVAERKPIVVAQSSAGELLYFDSEGVNLPYRLFSSVSDVPVLYGAIQGGAASGILPEQCLLFLRRYSEYNNGELYRKTGSLSYSARQHSMTVMLDDSGATAVLDTRGDVSEQLDKLRSVMQYLGAVNSLHLDLRWNGKAVVTGDNINT